MTPRIKDLSEIASASVDKLQTFQVGLAQYTGKFAELLIQECINAMWTDECHVSDLAVEEFNRNSTKIKRHFGIEL